MKESDLKNSLLLLSKAITQVTVNTYAEQGKIGVEKVLGILAQVEEICDKDLTPFNYDVEKTIEFLNERITIDKKSPTGNGCISIPAVEVEKIINILKNVR